jgi:hypothetical protein
MTGAMESKLPLGWPEWFAVMIDRRCEEKESLKAIAKGVVGHGEGMLRFKLKRTSPSQVLGRTGASAGLVLNQNILDMIFKWLFENVWVSHTMKCGFLTLIISKVFPN